MAKRTSNTNSSSKKLARAKATASMPPRRKLALKSVQYVLPLGNGWVVKDLASSKFTLITDNKREAVTLARQIAKTKGSQLIVYGRNGQIEKTEKYSAPTSSAKRITGK